jgi:hypothetical protein
MPLHLGRRKTACPGLNYPKEEIDVIISQIGGQFPFDLATTHKTPDNIFYYLVFCAKDRIFFLALRHFLQRRFLL